MTSCCVCCRKPRYKRLVDSLFPQDPQERSPVAANVDKLLYFAKSSPDHLDRMGDYLALRLRRSVQRERKGHTCVALKITEKLLSDCDQQRIQLIADSYLDMLHTMLESADTELQIMATSSFVVFAEREEGNTPYHRQYDFFIQRFASLSLVANNGDDLKYKETRLAGLKGLRGVIKKIGHQDSVQLNIWDIDHMNKIVPPFLFNMQHHWQQHHRGRSGKEGEDKTVNGREIEVVNDGDRERHGEEDNLANYAEASLKEVVQCAGLTHIDCVLRPILTHYDLNELWTKHRPFAVEVFVMVVETMPKLDRYKAMQALVSHLDAIRDNSLEVKLGILDTLSQCVAAAADGSLGPSVLDVFKTLVKQLTVSIESEQGSVERNQNLQDSLRFQDSLTKTMGEFAGVLPDYQKPDIMTLINSYMPTPDELSTVEMVSGAGIAEIREEVVSREHPLSDSNQQLMSSLVRCLKAVADSYNPAILDSTIPSNLFGSLVRLLAVKDPGTQLEVTKLWHQLIDQHQNKAKIPLHTEWQGLESVNLQLGKVSPFLGKMIPTLLAYLYDQAKILSTSRDNVVAYYQLLFLLMLELSRPSISDMVSFLSKLQDLAIKEESQLNPQQRTAMHAIVAGMLHLVAQISTNPVLKDNIGAVILCRRERAARLLPDGLFRGEESLDGGQEERLGGDTLGVDSELLFLLKDEASMKRVSESAASLKKSFGPFGRDSTSSGPDLASHFSVSLDYGPESPLNVDQISFNSLKEKMEVVLTSGEQEGRQSSFESTISPISTEITGSGRQYGVSFTSQTGNNISFEEAVVQASKEESGGLNLTDILNQASSPAGSSGIPIPKSSEPGRILSSSAYDMELPSLH